MTDLLQSPGLTADDLLQAPPGRHPLRRIVRRRPSAAFGALLLLLFVMLAVLAPLITPHGANHRVGGVYEAPSRRHWLGLDDAGIDVVSLLIEGSRISLLIGVAAMTVSMVVGGGVGLLAGYFGGAADAVLMRVTDYFLVVPALPLMIVIAAIWKPSVTHIVLVIGLLLWTWTARIIRAQVKSVRERVYVKRARAMGAGHCRIIFRHVLPQIAPLLSANVVLTVAYAIFYETALSFLGLGDPTSASWGTMLRHAFERTAISSGAWWAVVPPGVCISLVVMGCYLVGQAIEDGLNPRLRISHLSPRSFRLKELPAERPGL